MPSRDCVGAVSGEVHRLMTRSLYGESKCSFTDRGAVIRPGIPGGVRFSGLSEPQRHEVLTHWVDWTGFTRAQQTAVVDNALQAARRGIPDRPQPDDWFAGVFASGQDKALVDGLRALKEERMTVGEQRAFYQAVIDAGQTPRVRELGGRFGQVMDHLLREEVLRPARQGERLTLAATGRGAQQRPEKTSLAELWQALSTKQPTRQQASDLGIEMDR